MYIYYEQIVTCLLVSRTKILSIFFIKVLSVLTFFHSQSFTVLNINFICRRLNLNTNLLISKIRLKIIVQACLISCKLHTLSLYELIYVADSELPPLTVGKMRSRIKQSFTKAEHFFSYFILLNRWIFFLFHLNKWIWVKIVKYFYKKQSFVLSINVYFCNQSIKCIH